MVVTRGNRLHQNRSLDVENYCFEKTESFEYLGVDINSRNNYHGEIKLKPQKQVLSGATENRGGEVLSKISKTRLSKVLVKTVILYARERGQRQKRTKENQQFQKGNSYHAFLPFGPGKNDRTGEYEMRSNKEIKGL